MTIRKQIICDGCTIEIKEQDVYSVILMDKEMHILKGLAEASNVYHVCGHECLMKFVANNLVYLSEGVNQ